MDRIDLESWIRSGVKLKFSRSGGPGGQNVNKVNTKVTASLNLEINSPLGFAELARLKVSLANRINENGELVIRSESGRTQLVNRNRAIERMIQLVGAALVPAKQRHSTKPSRRANERRLTHKRAQGEKKRRRHWRDD